MNSTVTIVAAEVANLDGVQDAVLRLLGVGFTILLAFKLASAWARRDYGVMVLEFVAAIFAALFVFFPARGIALLTSFVDLVFP